MQTMEDRAAGTSPVPTPRCRIINGRGQQCTGEALDTDPKAIKICLRHAGEVLELVKDRQRAARTRRSA